MDFISYLLISILALCVCLFIYYWVHEFTGFIRLLKLKQKHEGD